MFNLLPLFNLSKVEIEKKNGMYRIKRFSSLSNKSKLLLGAASMPFIGYGIGYAAGYHGPSKKDVDHVKKLIDIDKKRLKEAEDNLKNIKNKGKRRNPYYEEDLYYAQNAIDNRRSSIDKESKHLEYLTSKQYKIDNAKKNASTGAKVGALAGGLTGLLGR